MGPSSFQIRGQSWICSGIDLELLPCPVVSFIKHKALLSSLCGPGTLLDSHSLCFHRIYNLVEEKGSTPQFAAWLLS